MKKVLLFVCIFLFPIIIFAKENVYIESADLQENNEVEEVSKISFSNLTINTNLRFSKVNSYIIYKIVINNEDKEDYELDKESFNSKTNNIEYSYKCNTENNIIKSKSKTTCFVKILYKEAVSWGDIIDNKTFKEEKTITLDLINNPTEEDSIINPKTLDSRGWILIGIILVLGLSSFIVIKMNKKKMMIPVIILLISLPTILYAINKITINIKSDVEVNGNEMLCSHKATNLREHIMCVISTDILHFKDIAKAELNAGKEKEYQRLLTIKQDLETGNRTFDNINYNNLNVTEIDNSIENFDEYYNKIIDDSLSGFEYFNDPSIGSIVDSFDWDSTFRKSPTKDTYNNYPEGIYVDNQRFIPIIREVTDESIRGYSFTKSKSQNVSDVVNISDLIKINSYEKDDKEYAQINLHGGFSYNNPEIETYTVSGILKLELSPDNNGKVIVSSWDITPECLSLVLLHAKLGIVNDMIDVYVSLYRSKIFTSNLIENGDFWHELLNLIDQLCSRYFQIMSRLTGIRKRNMYLHEYVDYKSEVFKKFIGLDFSGEALQKEFDTKYLLENENQYTEEEEEQARLAMEKAYFEHYGIEPELVSTTEFNKEYFYYTTRVKNIDFSRYKVIYNNKFYEGETGFFQFIADYLGIDTTNSTDLKETIYTYVTRK